MREQKSVAQATSELVEIEKALKNAQDRFAQSPKDGRLHDKVIFWKDELENAKIRLARTQNN